MTTRKAVKGFRGIYEVSADGEIYRIKPSVGAVIGPPLQGGTAHGYRVVYLCKRPGEKFCVHVAHVVCAAFHGRKPSAKHQVNHKNGIKTDNRAENLEWATPSQNTKHRFNVLGQKNPGGEQHQNHKLTEKQVSEIKRLALDGYPHLQVANHYGVKRVTVTAIAIGKNWPDILPSTHASNFGEKQDQRKRGDSNRRSKLSEADVVTIRASAERGSVLAARYGVSQALVSAVRLGRARQ